MAANPAQEGKKEEKQPMYRVYDMTAKDGEVRKHEIIVKQYPDGREPDLKTYGLKSDSPTEMPVDHAMKFLVDPAFKVERANGERITPPPKYDPSLPLSVGLDQTIANFDELSKAALYKRCKVLAGSDDININSPVNAMCDFLIAHRRKQVQGNLSDAEQALLARMQGGELGGQVGEAELNKMFGEKSPLVTA